MSKIVCFGEVLWDIFPTHKKIGGAPLNVACRLKSFNHDVVMMSAVGEDENRYELIEHLQEQSVDTKHIQQNTEYKTGEVNVMLNEKGIASYDIAYPRAWDEIKLTESNKKAVSDADVFVFGSLVARDERSRNTLYQLLDLAKYKVFDLNLRPPYYTENVLLHLLNKADFIKFNDEELYEVAGFLGSKYNSLEQNLMFIAENTNTRHICVTKGEHGAVLLYNEKLYYNSGYLIKLVDTVGAGDSFLGSLISQLLKNVNPQQAIDFACAVGALVAQREGANPMIELDVVNQFINP
ncbi:carbohydrate kinase [Aestuariibaculum sp. YM273]|uniref:carbohydrate kinase family protein n=1 Tax=Aestuariibaculum sp. YM273 TaxID=3070659 RepID=UPI0027DB3D3C|nr:carbohydrate kinase [Aestuariibaculum sp. YM273]WMI64799.1 carbohydrate kinase [Aestuariibaculum sp. YM273]